MKYEIGKEYDHNAVKEWPIGTIFKSKNPYLVNHGLWIVVCKDKVRGCHNAYHGEKHNLQSNDFSPNIDKSVFIPLEFGPEVFKIGDKIQAEDLHKLPAGSIIRLQKAEPYDDFLYLRVGKDELYRLTSATCKISEYGFYNGSKLIIEYIGGS